MCEHCIRYFWSQNPTIQTVYCWLSFLGPSTWNKLPPSLRQTHPLCPRSNWTLKHIFSHIHRSILSCVLSVCPCPSIDCWHVIVVCTVSECALNCLNQNSTLYRFLNFLKFLLFVFTKFYLLQGQSGSDIWQYDPSINYLCCESARKWCRSTNC